MHERNSFLHYPKGSGGILSAEKKTGLELLREPFPAHQVSKLPKPFRKDSQKGKCPECGGYHGLPAVHLDYVGHAALTARLLECDINWNWEPLATGDDGLPALDNLGGLWIRLTVCGQTRLGYGDAGGKNGPDAMKERIGDALRNAAMRFGAALDLWSKVELRPSSLTDEQMAEIRLSFEQATTIEDLSKAGAGAAEFADEEQRIELRDAYAARKKTLTKKGEKDA
jgi:hypothetical protein